jgi:hypothetical protein
MSHPADREGPAPAFLSIGDLRVRWSCSKSFVYVALAEMESAGYLRRLRLGRAVRVAVESVERWESEHTVAAAAPREERRRPPRASAPTSAGDAIRALRVA